MWNSEGVAGTMCPVKFQEGPFVPMVSNYTMAVVFQDTLALSTTK